MTVGHLLSSLPQARHHFHHHVEPNPEVDELRSLLREPHIQASYTPRTLLQLNSSNPIEYGHLYSLISFSHDGHTPEIDTSIAFSHEGYTPEIDTSIAFSHEGHTHNSAWYSSDILSVFLCACDMCS